MEVLVMLKVMEIITLKGWVDGSGWNFTQTYSDNIVDVPDVPMTAEEYDWSWYKTPEENPEDNGYDTKIIAEFYAEDAELGYDEPIVSFSKWESELWKERNT